VRTIESGGSALTFVTTLRPGEGVGAGVVSVDVNMLVYAFGMPFFAALTLAAREAKWWRTLAIGYGVIVPFVAWGVLADFLKGIAIVAPAAIASQTGFLSWQRELIAFAYQFGSLILPAVVPAVLWVLLHRAFLERLRGRICPQGRGNCAPRHRDIRCRGRLPRGWRFVGALAYSSQDAWTVWLASGLTLGVTAARLRTSWPAILGGAFVGATAFAILIGSTFDALGYGALEVLTAALGAWIASRLTDLPAKLDSPRVLAVLIFGGALPVAVSGALVAAVWNVAAGGTEGLQTFRVWALSNFVGTLLVAPLLLAWAQFRPKRSGGLPMSAFARRRARLCALPREHLSAVPRRTGTAARPNVGRGLIYVPIVFAGAAGVALGLARGDACGGGGHADRALRNRVGQGHSRASKATWAIRNWKCRRTPPRSR
jgi:hypothetical protein